MKVVYPTNSLGFPRTSRRATRDSNARPSVPETDAKTYDLRSLQAVGKEDPAIRSQAAAILHSIADGRPLLVEEARDLARAVLSGPAVQMALRMLDCDEHEIVTRAVALAAELLSGSGGTAQIPVAAGSTSK